MACISAWAVTSLRRSVRLCPVPMIRPSVTTTAPTGTSPNSKAVWASCRAFFIKYASSKGSIGSFWENYQKAKLRIKKFGDYGYFCFLCLGKTFNTYQLPGRPQKIEIGGTAPIGGGTPGIHH